jgi:gamma-glutamyltranspeptidase/glutathione hydrolase
VLFADAPEGFGSGSHSYDLDRGSSVGRLKMQGAIATPHALASLAGAGVYAAGGNAIDAALAAAMTLTVVYPHQCALGGDLFAVVAFPDGQSRSINGSGEAAAQLNIETLRSACDEMPDSGPVPITVPGVVGGWQSLYDMGASLDLARLLAPAIEAARDGVAVTRSLAQGILKREKVMRCDPGLFGKFFVDGKAIAQGATLRQPELASTLERLALSGLRDFYDGAIASGLVAALRRLGSTLAMPDFRDHETRVELPLSLSLSGLEFETSPPNSQGFVLLEALAGISALGIELVPAFRGNAALLRALLLAIGDRERYLGDPVKCPPPLSSLLNIERLRERLSATPADGDGAAARMAAGHGDTVAISALDSSGLGVSLIQSVYQLFGCGILEPATGIIFHNRGRGFSLQPGAPNELMPHTRPAHTLTPLIVRRAGRVCAVLGCMGGRAQPQILAQLLPGVIDPGTPLDSTLAAPRWVVGSKDIDFAAPTVAIEMNAPADWDLTLRTAGYDLQRIPVFSELVGHAQVIRVRHDGALEGASDPRSDGEAIVTAV